MAKTLFRRAVKTTLIGINLLLVALFLLACLSPYLNPTHWWLIGFTGLIVPYLVLLLIFFLIGWLIAKPVLALLPLVALCVGYRQLNVLFAWHPGSGINKPKKSNDLRVVDWNVQSFNGLSKNKETKKHIREEVAQTVLKLEPDVICMQEFNHASRSGNDADNLSLFTGRFPYYFFSKDYQRNNGEYQSGCIIFSKYPIVDTGRVRYPVAESLIYADIVKGADTIRLFTTHLQSFKFKKGDYNDLEKIRTQDEEALMASKNIFVKMRLAFRRRGVQASLVREALDASPYPTILCGDFNDVPNSFTYFHIKDSWQDAFLKKGFGIGRSFISLAPTLRIDYILADKHFEVRQFDMVDEDLSDHIMLISDLRLRK
ncbi:Metal-dependent hydrolase, endonuclease/exonuclease/phosphatase family [Hydrobacter penzbergensis]|uniref:Metal-dependent hydrolase, endonuclease/exonuclease/phosphatase family n=1 Tax=Hydrobacter penzbergensis TaxID=1235997 RepID=A0A8X8IFK4_9BACT|nr:endonuclease/exonuclease/phosphatase family protein [Hydrobacter penzbergensis]SDX56664.1 Metal-dependent hydrolase, endonuclease/exonuclease/phosphatase family [Hydrobacter penzbergensis]